MTAAGVPFEKMTAGGNDFVILDAADLDEDVDGAALARRLCDRRLGIGADGLFVVSKSGLSPVSLGFWNADGSEAGLCANGTSCAARFACEGKTGEVRLGTRVGELAADVAGDLVALEMPPPTGIDLHGSVELEGRSLSIHRVDTGCPHVVVLEAENGPIDFLAVAPVLRSHEAFGPAGANVDVVSSVQSPQADTRSVRFWERGVEGETLSCGTGAVAVAIVSALVEDVHSPVRIVSPGGRAVTVSFTVSQGVVSRIRLEGRVTRVFRGRVPLI